MKNLSVKICGMADPVNISRIAGLHTEWLGLIFAAASPRNALKLNDIELLQTTASTKFVGVFVNATREEILDRALRFRLSAVQLHGDESPDFCRSLQGHGFEVWKAIGIANSEDIAGLGSYSSSVDRFVFDRKSRAGGGTGLKFDWKLLDSYTLDIPFMLGGGIGPEDAADIAGLDHPRLAGLDLNSRFEDSPGIKNYDKLHQFLTQINKL
ncbi:MAG: phosphoribosylanthranilate isomerase [Staphylococcus sp.]|nr:phosphoribosylanthranilate isomerase [Staphylococcus sp.]